jgi:chemotaxis family two-component system sensor kinase Cph1
MSPTPNSLDPGSHICLLYRSIEEQKEVVLPFIKEGLERGEQCVYVADEQTADDWCFEFQAHGIDVAEARKNRSLIVCSGEHWRMPGQFSSVQNSRAAWRMIEGALANFTGIRFAVDAGWTLDPPISNDLVCHWEATQNLVIADSAVSVLCQYNINRHSATAVHSALRTHPHAIAGGKLRPNPYYEAPRILENEPHLNHSDADAGAVEGMLINLASHHQPA